MHVCVSAIINLLQREPGCLRSPMTRVSNIISLISFPISKLR